MSGLVGYGSSDEDDDDHNGQQAKEPKKPNTAEEKSANASTQDTRTEKPVTTAKLLANATPQGPIAGPAMAPQEDAGLSTEEQNFESNQVAIMNLTLPPVPNFDIPESPPGSPDPSVVAKLEQFAQLKKQGVHFNEKLASSSAIKNPNLFSKLLTSFGIDETNQYATTLPSSVWDPAMFPEWAYKEQLAKAQAEANQQRRQAGTGSSKLADNFVAASNPDHKASRK